MIKLFYSEGFRWYNRKRTLEGDLAAGLKKCSGLFSVRWTTNPLVTDRMLRSFATAWVAARQAEQLCHLHEVRSE